MLSKSNSAIIFYVAIVGIVLAFIGGYLTPAFNAINIHSDYNIACTALIIGLGAIAFLIGAEISWIMIIGSMATFIALSWGQDPLIRYLTLAAMLFTIGLYGMTVSRNAVRVLMSIELMLNAANINLVAFARYVDPAFVRGQIFAIFILTVAAAEAAVGLAIVLAIYRNSQSINMEKFNLLKW